MIPPMYGIELQPLDIPSLIAFILATLMWSLIIWRIRRWAKNRQAKQANQQQEEKS